MLEYKEGVGIKFTDLLNHENQEQDKTPELLSGAEIAELAEGLYEQLSPRLNYHLVDSNVVLTLGGLKPSTWFSVDIEHAEDIESFKTECERANTYLAAAHSAIRFSVEGTSTNTIKGKQAVSSIIHVRNLLGYERTTNTTKIKQIIPFDHSQGFDGLKKWYQQSYIKLDEARQNGELPEDYDIDSVLEGIEYGYPDVAIQDMETWDKAGRPPEKIADTNIPNTQIYKEANPNFIYLAEHAEDEGIRNYVEGATAILKDFYESDWHQSKANDLVFHKAKSK